MFLYSVYGYECHCTLSHEKEYTKEEFEKMCEEAPLGGTEPNDYAFYYDETVIKHLIDNYGFKKIEFTAKFFTGF